MSGTGNAMISTPGKSCEAMPLGVMEQLQCKRDQAVKQLEEIDKAIEVFKQHPEVELALTQLSRVGIYR